MKIGITKLAMPFLALLTASCVNQDIEFNDFAYTSTYFPWQYPVRTLVLGSSEYYNNTNDINHRFEIKASMGGVYANKANRNIQFVIDSSLADSLYYSDGIQNKKLVILPSQYYEPITNFTMTIPSGKFNGGVTIQLTDAFFADPLACSNTYVLPLRIISADTDSILNGRQELSASTSPIPSIAHNWKIDPRIASSWKVVPKNYTVYAIKFVNKYHGIYLRRGAETSISATSNQRKYYGWENEYIEKTTYTPKLTTLSLSKLQYDDMLAVSKLKFKAILNIDKNNIVTMTGESSTGDVQISGNGLFTSDTEEWGAKKRMAFYLDYQVVDLKSGKSYQVNDTLVYRDNAVAVEEYKPIINNPKE